MFDQYYLNDDGEKVYFHEEHGMRFEWMKPEDIKWKKRSNSATPPEKYSLLHSETCIFLGYNLNNGNNWNGNKTTTVFEQNGTIYYGPTISNLLNPNRKLFSCSRIIKYTKESLYYYLMRYNDNFKSGSLKIIDNNINNYTAHTKFYIKCSECGHIYKSHANILINMNSGCKQCYNKIVSVRCLMKEENILSCAQILINEKKYPYVIKSNSFKNGKKSGGKYCILDIFCDLHKHNWSCSYNDFKNNESKCVYCFPSGYNNTLPAYLYIHEITSRISDNKYYKIGITKNLKQRLSQYKKNVLKTNKFKAFYCEDGKVIQDIERYIKKESGIEIGVLSKRLYESGYTETIHGHDLHKVLKIINQFMSQHRNGNHIEMVML